jgi:hypothetical protein
VGPRVVWEDLARELSALEPVPQAGKRLGRYELRGLLGVGGMSRVYKAFDPVLAREVAIKALSEALQDEAPELRRRLEREARLLATVSHPNVATIHGFELIDGAPYLVLELVGPDAPPSGWARCVALEQAVSVARFRWRPRSGRHIAGALSIGTSSPRTSSSAPKVT